MDELIGLFVTYLLVGFGLGLGYHLSGALVARWLWTPQLTDVSYEVAQGDTEEEEE